MSTRKKVSVFLGMFVIAFTIMFAKSQLYITAETVSHHIYLQQHETQVAETAGNQVAVVADASIAHVYVSNDTDSSSSSMNLIWILAGSIAVVCFGITKLSGNLL